MRGSLVCVAIAVLASGCGSFAGDMKMMCDAPKHVAVNADPAIRATELAEYISKNIRSREARELFQSMGTVSAEEKAKHLEDAVKRGGIEPANCELLRLYQP